MGRPTHKPQKEARRSWHRASRRRLKLRSAAPDQLESGRPEPVALAVRAQRATPASLTMTREQRAFIRGVLRREIARTEAWSDVGEDGRRTIIQSTDIEQLSVVLRRLRERDLTGCRRRIRTLMAEDVEFELSHEEQLHLYQPMTPAMLSAEWRCVWHIHEAMRAQLSHRAAKRA